MPIGSLQKLTMSSPEMDFTSPIIWCKAFFKWDGKYNSILQQKISFPGEAQSCNLYACTQAEITLELNRNTRTLVTLKLLGQWIECTGTTKWTALSNSHLNLEPMLINQTFLQEIMQNYGRSSCPKAKRCDPMKNWKFTTRSLGGAKTEVKRGCDTLKRYFHREYIGWKHLTSFLTFWPF